MLFNVTISFNFFICTVVGGYVDRLPPCLLYFNFSLNFCNFILFFDAFFAPVDMSIFAYISTFFLISSTEQHSTCAVSAIITPFDGLVIDKRHLLVFIVVILRIFIIFRNINFYITILLISS